MQTKTKQKKPNKKTTLEKASGNKKNVSSLILTRASLVPMSSGFLFHNLGAVNVRSLWVFDDFLLS